MILPSLPNFTLNLFLIAVDVTELPKAESQISSRCKPENGHGSEQVEIGKGGPGLSDNGSEGFKFPRPVSRLTVGPWTVSCNGLGREDVWPISNKVVSSLAYNLLKLSALLVLPNLNLNLPRSTLWTNVSINSSGDSGIWSRPYAAPCNTSSLSTFKVVSMRPPWLPPKSSALRWAWVEGDGPLITNGELRESQLNSSETDSDSVTVTMFSLDMFCKLEFDFL